MKNFKKDCTLANVDYLSSKWLTFLLFIVMAAGCSDSGSPVGPDPTDGSNITIQGSISGPAGVSGKEQVQNKAGNSLEINAPDSSKSSPGNEIRNQDTHTADLIIMAESALSGEVPLSDVTVLIYEASDYISNQSNAALLASTTTDSEGNYSISDIDEGLDLVIVVDSDPRLTSAISGAVEESNGNVNSATAIVSEYWAGEIANSRTFDRNDFEEMLQTATDLLDDMTSEDLYNVLDELVPDQFGYGFPGNLSPETQLLVSSLLGHGGAVCETIVFDAASGKPTNYVLVEGLSDDFGQDPLAWVYDSEDMDEDNRHGVFIERLNGNMAELLIPVHPGNYLEGGSALIVIYNEDQSIICPGISFEIEALVKAPGTFKGMIDHLEDAFEGMVQNFGYSSSDELLTADVSELPNEVKALAASLQIIDGPNNPNNIRQILSGDAPVLEGNPLDNEVLELFDALMNESGLSETAIRFNDLFNTQAKLMNSSTSAGCFVMPENISTPGELNCWMGVQAWFENANQGLAREIRDLTGSALGVGAVVALATGVGAPVAAVLGMSATAVTMMAIFIDANDNTLPSQLLGFELLADPTTYNNEDDDTEGEWTADLAAESNGWTLNWATVLVNVPGLGKIAGIFNKTGIPNAAEFLLQNFQREINNVWEADSGPIDLSPQIFQVTVDTDRDSEYLKWESNTTSSETSIDPFQFTHSEQKYNPKAVGTSKLRIETRGGDVFKGQNVFNEVDLEVIGINITLAEWIGQGISLAYASPLYINVQEELSLEARVVNAINKEVNWSVTPEASGLSILELSGNDNVAEVLATEPGRYTVEVESVADTGPRADNNPRKYDRVTIWVGGLNVSNPGCVETNESVQLTAQIGGEPIGFSELEWDIDGSGTIDSHGLYTAGGAGSVTIIFSIRTDPEQTDTITFQVRDMCGSFRLVSSEFDFDGSCVTFFEDGIGGAGGVKFGSQSSDDRHGGISFHIDFREFREISGDKWSVENPGWTWSSHVVPNLPSMVTPSWFFNSELTDGFSELIVTQQMRGDEAVLSGSFVATHVWNQETEDGMEERESEVSGTFNGARDHRVDTCWDGS